MGFIVRRGAHLNDWFICEAWLNGKYIPLVQWVLRHAGRVYLIPAAALRDPASVPVAHDGAALPAPVTAAELLDRASGILRHGAGAEIRIEGEAALLAQLHALLAIAAEIPVEGEAELMDPASVIAAHSSTRHVTLAADCTLRDPWYVLGMHKGGLALLFTSGAEAAVLPPERMASAGQIAAGGAVTLGCWELPYEDADGYLVIPQSYAVTTDGDYLTID